MKLSKLFSRPWFLVVETSYLIALPLALIYLFPQVIHYRLHVMTAGLIYIFLVSRLLRFKLRDLGLRVDNFARAFRSLRLPTLLAMFFTTLLFVLTPENLIIDAVYKEIGSYPIIYPLLVYFLFSSPLQEMVFRAFLIPRLKKISTSPSFLITFSSLIFGLVHLPLGNHFLTIVSFFLGIIWSKNFVKYNNFFALSLSHSLIGGLLILFTGLLR